MEGHTHMCHLHIYHARLHTRSDICIFAAKTITIEGGGKEEEGFFFRLAAY